MEWARSVGNGLFRGKGKLMGTLLIWGSGFLLATIFLNPVRSGFHTLFDGAPASRALLHGSGIDLLFNTGLHQPAFWSAAAALLPYMILLAVVVGLVLTSGVYAQAVEGSGSWRAFWRGSAANVLPFAALLLLNLLLWAVVSLGVGLFFAAAWHGLRDAMDPAKPWHLFWITLWSALIVVNLFRNSLGFSQARWVLTGGGEGVARCFMRSVAFTFRRFVPVNLMTWLLNLVRAGAMILAVFTLSPGYGTTSRWFATAALLQGGFLFAAYLRVGEARAQVLYTRVFLAPATVGVAPMPAGKDEEPSVAAAPVSESEGLEEIPGA
ncbi:MAG: hypothetical protein ACP5VF_00375 [Acidobacteriota bacterium]